MTRSFFVRAYLFTALVAVAPALAHAQPSSPRVTWSLEEVIGAAIAQHPLVEAATARVTAAEGSRRTAGVLANPIGTYWVEHGALAGGLGNSMRETQAYLTLPLEPLFQRASRVRRADEEINAATANVQSARRQVALDTARLFFRVALAQAAVEAAQQNRAGLDRLVTYNRARLSQGAIAEVELIRAEVEFDRATANGALADVELTRSRAELWAFLGYPQDAPNGFAVVLPDVATAIHLASLTDYLSQAREHRPEIASARARVAATAADIDYQRRLAVRQLGASLGVKRSGGSNSWLGGISIPLPLFDQNRGEVQRATGESLAAQKDLAWSERAVSAEVRSAFGATQQLASQVAALRNAFVDRAAEADRITLAAYQEGAASLLQVLDTLRALAESRLTYSRLLIAARQSALELTLSAGADPATLSAPATIRPVTSVEGGEK